MFADLHRSVQPGMSPDDLAKSAAWQAGWVYFENGFYWEAHEALEVVWMATSPNSVERHAVQALIQTANAGLKLKMGRPNAVRRLCDMAQAHLDACGTKTGTVMGVTLADLAQCLARVRQQRDELVQNNAQ